MFTAAMPTGSSSPLNGNHSDLSHDPDEEVGREERSEEHDLGDDEKQHPEELRLDARGDVGGRRAVMFLVGGDGGRFHQAPSSLTMCSTGFPVDASTRPMRSARSQPERVSGKRRDHDVVRPVELERVLDRRVRVGMDDLPDGLEPGLLKRRERVREALVGVPLGIAVAARVGGDHDEAPRLLRGLALERVEQRLPADRLIGDHQRALDVVALAVEVHDHVLDVPPGGAREPVHEPLAQPARARLGVGGDDDLVVVLLAQSVHHRRVRVGVHDLAVRLDPRVAQQRERHVEAVLGGVADVLVVHHEPVLGLVLRADDVDVDVLVPAGAALDRVDQRPAGDRFVCDYEDPLHSVMVDSGPGSAISGGGAPPPPAGVGTAAGAFSLNTACTAPGTPYS